MVALEGDEPEFEAVRRVWGIAHRARTGLGDVALDVVPGYTSVLVRFDPSLTTIAYVMAVLRGAAEQSSTAADSATRRFRIGVRFGDEYGEDLERTARESGMTAKRFIDQFCRAEYKVAFLGFIAGFPYLMGLPAALAAPRLPSPRDRVPQGSLAIAGTQCGIYPRESPGGWRLLGRTSAVLFDVARDPVTLLSPGDSVMFAAVGKLKDAGAEQVRR